MNNFFNLRLIKYPLSLLIIGLGVGIYLKVFPPKQVETTNDFGMGAINLKLANSDTTIKEKKVFQEPSATNTEGNPDTYLGTTSEQEKVRNAQIVQQNKAANFRRQTYYPNHYEGSRNTQSKHQTNHNADTFSANEAKHKAATENVTIEILRNRLQQLEGKPKQDSLNHQGKNVVADGVNHGKRYDKNGFLLLDKVPITEAMTTYADNNHFYSNGKQGNKDELAANQVPVHSLNRNAKQNYQLIKARLVEDKTVRDNSSIKLMVVETAIVNGIQVEKGQIILGKCAINADRLVVMINGYIKEDAFYPLEGRVLDVDGGDGLSINASFDMKQSKKAWGQNASSALGSVNPLLVYQPTGNIGTTVANQVVGSLVNQSLNGANQFLNAKMNDVKANIKTGQLLYIQIKMN